MYSGLIQMLTRCAVVLAAIAMTSTVQGAVITAGLIDWFDPTTGVTTGGGGQITGWQNQSIGNDINIGDPHATLVQGPHGRSMVRFNNESGDDGLQYASSGDLGFGYTIVAVVRFDQEIDTEYARIHRGTDDSHALFIRQETGELEFKADTALGELVRPTAGFADYFAPGEVAVVSVRTSLRQVTIPFVPLPIVYTDLQMSINGQEIETRTVTAPGSVSYRYPIDDIFEIGNGMRGDIGDVLVYDSSVSPEAINMTVEHFMQMYVVPEPASFVVVGVGGAMLLSRRRRH